VPLRPVPRLPPHRGGVGPGMNPGSSLVPSRRDQGQGIRVAGIQAPAAQPGQPRGVGTGPRGDSPPVRCPGGLRPHRLGRCPAQRLPRWHRRGVDEPGQQHLAQPRVHLPRPVLHAVRHRRGQPVRRGVPVREHRPLRHDPGRHRAADLRRRRREARLAGQWVPAVAGSGGMLAIPPHRPASSASPRHPGQRTCSAGQPTAGAPGTASRSPQSGSRPAAGRPRPRPRPRQQTALSRTSSLPTPCFGKLT
jgi:hypothetical protein